MQFVRKPSQVSLSKTDTLSKANLSEMQQHYTAVFPEVYGFSVHIAYFGFYAKNPATPKEYQYRRFVGPCHSSWTNCVTPETDGVMSFQVRNLRPKINKEFIDYLYSERRSPWGACFKDTAVILDSGVIKDFPIGIIFLNVKDINLKFMTNFLVATRYNSGFGLDLPWWNLRNAGFSEDTALILASIFSWYGPDYNKLMEHYIYPTKNAKLRRTGPVDGDQPLFTTKAFIPKDFYDRTPTLDPKDTIPLNCRAQPNNNIWHKGHGTYQTIADTAKTNHSHIKIKHFDKTCPITECAEKGTALDKSRVKEIEDTLRSGGKIEI